MKTILFILLFTPLLCLAQETSTETQKTDFATKLSLLEQKVQTMQLQQEQFIMSLDKTQNTYYIGIALFFAGYITTAMTYELNPENVNPLFYLGIASTLSGSLISTLSFRNLAKRKTTIRYNNFNKKHVYE